MKWSISPTRALVIAGAPPRNAPTSSNRCQVPCQVKRGLTRIFARISDGEYAFYRARAPGPVPLAQLVRVAGSRWRIEDGFAAGKELAALDEHQVRSWTSWHRWTILALLAHAFLAVLAAA